MMNRYPTKDGKCLNCGKTAVLHSTGECSWCTSAATLFNELEATDTPDNQEAKFIGSRTMGPSLKESKVFDAERLNSSPLFNRRLF